MFQALADSIGFPVDQVRYITLLFLSYPLAYVFRYVLHPSQVTTLTRHIFSISFGLFFGFLCFGMEMFILFGVVGVSYALLRFVPATVVQRYSMVWAMGSMSAAHYYRLVTDFGGWHLDFTGPLMVMVQRITLVAFALHDGKTRKDSSLNEDQRAQKIDVCPSLLEYFTYMFNFHSFLAGPSCTLKEFLSFMDGSNLEQVKVPSATFPVVSKLIYSLVCLGGYIFLGQYYFQYMIIDPQHSVLRRTVIVAFYAIHIRFRYYFLWLLVDSISNLAGLGFSGYDKMGNPKWDVVTNVDIMGLEAGTSLRSIVNSWNITTTMWLRRVCYERVTISPTIMTYILSAWWHGFYPGYYLSFIFFGVATEAARKMRRLVRPHFQSSLPLKWFYDFLTFVMARFYLDFGIMPFDLMWIPPSLLFWSYWFYVPHIVTCVVLFLFPSGKSSRPDKKDKNQPAKEASEVKAKPE